MSDDIVSRAKALAYRAHEGQVDKAGRPYIEHVARVAAAVSDDPVAEAVAWLHDVQEDCPNTPWPPEWLPLRLMWPCDKLCRPAAPNETRYYERIKDSPIALRVKLADIADNSNEERLALLDPKTANRLRAKYRKAMEALS